MKVKDVLTFRLVNSYFERLFRMWMQSNELKLRKEINDDAFGELTFLDYERTTINLTWCDEITDNGLQYLVNCTNINLFDCRNITDNGLQYLANCTTINLAYCRNITDNGLQYLANCNIFR